MSPDSTPAEGGGARRVRVGYLGPEGTFTEEALLCSASPGTVEPVALRTIYDTILALTRREVEWAVAPIENSLDGSVSVTLDLLGSEEGDLEIVGETLLSVRHSLIASGKLELSEIDTVLTHPQVPGQCERFLRGELGHATVLPASSTAEAVRMVAAGQRRGQAALGTVLAAKIYDATVLREGVQDRDDNQTRFVWLARAHGRGGVGTGGGPADRTVPREDDGQGNDGEWIHTPPLRPRVGGGWKTSLVFWGPGADSPGWLVRCLDEFGRREINLTKIESRPKRDRMGSYMFFVDLQGRVSDPAIAEAVAALAQICEQARVLGSYRTSSAPAETGASGSGTEKHPSGNRHDEHAPSLHSGATDG
ncbi:MAG TPA: prephenate dehydratase [Solirubrobacteraceae bacterium]|jgi:prephenate dehydratase|nr:prephenate dehydratase [Solirubrobacteraceae bacterium]